MNDSEIYDAELYDVEMNSRSSHERSEFASELDEGKKTSQKNEIADEERVREHSETERIMSHTQKMRYRLVAEGAVVGVLAGALSIFYRLALHHSERIMRSVLEYSKGSIPAMAGWFCILILLSAAVWLLIRKEPLISGSGIPQVEGELIGFIDQKWYRVLPAKIAGGILCILGGLSLGREGPSIQLGAMAGKGLSKGLKRTRTEENHLITCGASAGLAAAFNAPLAGIMFALEEIHKSFSITILFSVMTASVSADFLSKYIFGLDPVFHFPVDSGIALHQYWMILILGVILGALGAFYNKFTLKVQSLYQKVFPAKTYFRLLVPFLTAGVLGFALPQVLGSGHTMIGMLTEGNMTISFILLLLVAKFLFSVMSFGSGAPGGIFFPLLVLGAFIGGAFGTAAVQYLGVDPALVNNFIILAMAGFFTAIVRAPITGIVLISEMTGSLNHLLSLSTVSIVAYVTADLLRSAPIYESLLSRILQNQGIALPEGSPEKSIITQTVQQGSMADHHLVSDILWPQGCLLVGIKRGREELIPKGDTLLLPSDSVIAIADADNAPVIKAHLKNICSEDEWYIEDVKYMSDR